jgi:hypothetical protein
VAAALWLFAPLADFAPQPALAGVLLCTAWRIVDPRRLWDCLRWSRADAAVILTTVCAAVFIRIDVAVLVGIVSSLQCRGLVLQTDWKPFSTGRRAPRLGSPGLEVRDLQWQSSWRRRRAVVGRRLPRFVRTSYAQAE